MTEDAVCSCRLPSVQGPDSSVGLTKAFVAQPLRTSPSLAPGNIVHPLSPISLSGSSQQPWLRRRFLQGACGAIRHSQELSLEFSAVPRAQLHTARLQLPVGLFSLCSRLKSKMEDPGCATFKAAAQTSKPGAEETLRKSLVKNNILFHLLVCCLS